ncbi:MAG: hypothetical protein ACRDPY_13755 [Streptosporangiaceae bacterium]
MVATTSTASSSVSPNRRMSSPPIVGMAVGGGAPPARQQRFGEGERGALHGALARIEELGLELLEVRQSPQNEQ